MIMLDLGMITKLSANPAFPILFDLLYVLGIWLVGKKATANLDSLCLFLSSYHR